MENDPEMLSVSDVAEEYDPFSSDLSIVNIFDPYIDNNVCTICCHEVDGEYVKSIASNEPMNRNCPEYIPNGLLFAMTMIAIVLLCYLIFSYAGREEKTKKK